MQRSPCSFQPTVLNANSPILLAKEYLEPNQVRYSQHFTISCMTTTLALRTLQEIRRRPAKPRTGEPLHLGKPGCREQGAVSKMSIPGTSRGIHYEFTEIQERHRIRTDVTWVPAQAIWINCFPHYKTNLDHGKLSHLMVSIGGGLCCSGRSSSFGPWDGMGTLLFWEVLMDDSHWFSPYLPIWRRDTVPSRQTPVKRRHHQLLHAYGEWTQHHFGIPAVSESNLCRHDTHMPQYTCTLYVLGTVP